MLDPIPVLLVEDDPAFARLIGAMLALDPGSAFTLVHVTTLAEALVHLAQGAPEVIILDLGLPDSQGLVTYTSVQSAARDTCILVASGNDDEAVAIEAVRLGAQDYLLKGALQGRSIVRAIRYGIERNRLQRELRTALANVRQLEGILPICASCKQIRGTAGEWQRIESYITERTGSLFSHGVCPDCAKRLYGDLMAEPK